MSDKQTTYTYIAKQIASSTAVEAMCISKNGGKSILKREKLRINACYICTIMQIDFITSHKYIGYTDGDNRSLRYDREGETDYTYIRF